MEKLNASLNEKVREQQRTAEELSLFTASASMNIREPLRLIYTGLESVIKKDGSNLSDSGKATFRKVQVSINKMNLLLDDLISLTRFQNTDEPMTAVNLHLVMNNAVHSLRKKMFEKNVAFHSDPLPSVKGYENMLFQLCYQLIDNAIKFQHPGVRPEIHVEVTPPLRKGNTSCTGIRFRDNGIGFDEANKEKIFRPFEKLHSKNIYPGSGKGLSVCRKIMEIHGGFIEVESAVDRGSAFTCYFPKEQKV
ncbi:MAG: HAMP domain-containing histidine kinase [Bacteroidetes bacterium]|nr:HAMP domain-containing histidine kinase [Bacteroidota bacterium]